MIKNEIKNKICIVLNLLLFMGCTCTNVETKSGYWENGTKAIMFSVIDDQINGELFSWDIDGTLIAKGVISDNTYLKGSFIVYDEEKHGLFIEEYNDGKLIKKRSMSENSRVKFFINRNHCSREYGVCEVMKAKNIPTPPLPSADTDE